MILGILWIIAPTAIWYISKDIKEEEAVERITKQDKDYLKEIGIKIWQYFKDNINEGNSQSHD